MADEKWTIMVYMAGDNNLNLEMAYALEEIKAVINENINLYVYFDGFSSNVPTLYCDFSEPQSPTKFYRSYDIEDKLIKRKKSRADGLNENSASMYSVINFVDWCVRKDKFTDAEGNRIDRRKDKKYAMIFSGHSFGFLNWGLFKDEKAGYYMTLKKLKWLFERITFKETDLKNQAKQEQEEARRATRRRAYRGWDEKKLRERTTEILGKPLDLLGFDSCVMSTLEIGSQFVGLAQTMVASEGSVPNAGWNYAQILLGKLKKEPEASADSVAISFVDDFIKQQNKFALADISVDMAAWKLGALTELHKSFKGLAENLLKCFEEKNSTVYHQMRRLLTQVHWECQTYMFEQNVDLGDFCRLLNHEIELLKREVDESRIAPIIEVGKSCRQILKDLMECILVTGYSGTDFQFSSGMSVFFPWSWASYQAAAADYNNLEFISKNDAGVKWNEFLIKYIYEVTLRCSNQSTPTDDNGNIVVDPEIDSVVYKSYDLLTREDGDENSAGGRNDTKQPPDGFRQPPDGFRQPPDGFRQPPDGFRMFSNMSIFMSRFMKLKNFQSNWNQTGFTSRKVKFKPKTDSRTQDDPKRGVNVPKPQVAQAGKNPPHELPEIEIPSATGIHDLQERILSTVRELTEGKRTNVDYKSFEELLNDVSQNAGRDANVRVLADISKTVLPELENANGNFENNLYEALTKSISSVDDAQLKGNLEDKVNKIIPR